MLPVLLGGIIPVLAGLASERDDRPNLFFRHDLTSVSLRGKKKAPE
jgi:hypothetical protein